MVDGLNALNMMLPGVAVTYQGEEIGMRDGYVSWEDTVDIEACNRLVLGLFWISFIIISLAKNCT